jgi:hypothetical protein
MIVFQNLCGGLIFIGLLIANASNCAAQDVQHNYELGPQFTSCDSLKIEGLSLEKSISQIRSAKYRLQQSFRLTRRQGLKKAEFFSCNGQEGFLIILYNEKEVLFEDITRDYWEKLRRSSDPEGMYLKLNAAGRENKK